MTNIPEKIGVCASLLFIPKGPSIQPQTQQVLAHLGDALLVHETAAIRADLLTVEALYLALEPTLVQALLDDNRLKFVPATAATGLADEDKVVEKDWQNIYASQLYSRLSDSITADQHDVDIIVGQVLDNIEEPIAANPEHWEKLFNDLVGFWPVIAEYLAETLEASSLSQYAINENIQSRRTGFEIALARAVDMWASGYEQLYVDSEFSGILNILQGELEGEPQVKDIVDRSVKASVADEVHSIRNLPNLGRAVLSHGWDINKWIELVNGPDAHQLRQWLKTEMEPGLDVRDAYRQELQELPSKKEWTKWLRFGTQSGLVTAVSVALAGDPVVSTTVGLALGAADLTKGEEVVSYLFDDYHPRSWLEYFESEIG